MVAVDVVTMLSKFFRDLEARDFIFIL